MSWTTIAIVCLTALLSSATTLLAVWLAYRLVGRRWLDRELEELERAVEARVHAGVLAAGEELMPEFREEVRAGFRQALSDAVAGGVVDITAREMARKGGKIMETGLNMIFGKPSREDPSG